MMWVRRVQLCSLGWGAGPQATDISVWVLAQALKYPATDGNTDAHTDYGCITLLLPGDQGLQVSLSGPTGWERLGGKGCRLARRASRSAGSKGG